MGTADARCHLMACCANGEGEVEAGDDDRPLVLRACELDDEELRQCRKLICWRSGGQAEFLGEPTGACASLAPG